MNLPALPAEHDIEETLQSLRSNCQQAPRYGANGKYLILQAARLVAEKEKQLKQKQPAASGVPAGSGIPTPSGQQESTGRDLPAAVTAPAVVAPLTASKAAGVVPTASRPFVPFKARAYTTQQQRQQVVNRLFGLHLVLLLQDLQVPVQQQQQVICSCAEVAKAASVASLAQEAALYKQAVSAQAYTTKAHQAAASLEFLPAEQLHQLKKALSSAVSHNSIPTKVTTICQQQQQQPSAQKRQEQQHQGSKHEQHSSSMPHAKRQCMSASSSNKILAAQQGPNEPAQHGCSHGEQHVIDNLIHSLFDCSDAAAAHNSSSPRANSLSLQETLHRPKAGSASQQQQQHQHESPAAVSECYQQSLRPEVGQQGQKYQQNQLGQAHNGSPQTDGAVPPCDHGQRKMPADGLQGQQGKAQTTCDQTAEVAALTEEQELQQLRTRRQLRQQALRKAAAAAAAAAVAAGVGGGSYCYSPTASPARLQDSESSDDLDESKVGGGLNMSVTVLKVAAAPTPAVEHTAEAVQVIAAAAVAGDNFADAAAAAGPPSAQQAGETGADGVTSGKAAVAAAAASPLPAQSAARDAAAGAVSDTASTGKAALFAEQGSRKGCDGVAGTASAAAAGALPAQDAGIYNAHAGASGTADAADAADTLPAQQASAVTGYGVGKAAFAAAAASILAQGAIVGAAHDVASCIATAAENAADPAAVAATSEAHTASGNNYMLDEEAIFGDPAADRSGTVLADGSKATSNSVADSCPAGPGFDPAVSAGETVTAAHETTPVGGACEPRADGCPQEAPWASTDTTTIAGQLNQEQQQQQPLQQHSGQQHSGQQQQNNDQHRSSTPGQDDIVELGTEQQVQRQQQQQHDAQHHKCKQVGSAQQLYDSNGGTTRSRAKQPQQHEQVPIPAVSSKTIHQDITATITAQVSTFVASVLDPLVKAAVVSTKLADKVCSKATTKVMQRHQHAMDSSFLVREYNAITRLVTDLLDHYQKQGL